MRLDGGQRLPIGEHLYGQHRALLEKQALLKKEELAKNGEKMKQVY